LWHRLIVLAFEQRSEGAAAVDKAVGEAAKLRTRSQAVRDHKPADKTKKKPAPKEKEPDRLARRTGEMIEEAQRLLAATLSELVACVPHTYPSRRSHAL
jgi:hypothetical protein